MFEVHTGGVAGTVADPKVIFSAASKANASSLILVHNHPSGNTNLSEADGHLTRKIWEAGKLGCV
ncbi:JAB domain-containing protein [Pontibacter rufus]|uniref:JAB domain-containing protein n=1 Tax=Pontibacter rufus TaxID=2791028 RepID=UPI00351C7C64